MVEMAVPDDDCIGFFDVGCGKSQRRIILAPIEIGIQQYDLAFLGKLEIGKARTGDDQLMRIPRTGSASRCQPVAAAGRIVRLRQKLTRRESRTFLRARIGERLGARVTERKKCKRGESRAEYLTMRSPHLQQN